MRFGEEIGDRLGDRRADAFDAVELGERLAVAVRRSAHRLEESCRRAVVPRQEPRRGLAHMRDAERVDEAVEPDVAPRLDCVEQLLSRGLAPPLALGELAARAFV